MLKCFLLSLLMATAGGLLPCDGVDTVRARLAVPVSCCSLNTQEESHLDKNTQAPHCLQRTIVNVRHPLLELVFSSWICLSALTWITWLTLNFWHSYVCICSFQVTCQGPCNLAHGCTS
jgi:hypothetical protein